jgi:hypothetical protein
MAGDSSPKPDLKWEKLAEIGRGKAAIIHQVHNTVSKEVQPWKYIHSPNRRDSREKDALRLLQDHDNVQKVLHWADSCSVLLLEFRKWRRPAIVLARPPWSSTKTNTGDLLVAFPEEHGSFLAYCQAGWKEGDPFVIKDGWRPILHLDIVEGNVLVH